MANRTNAERQKAYYEKHKEEKRMARALLGVSTYTWYHRKSYMKTKKGDYYDGI